MEESSTQHVLQVVSLAKEHVKHKSNSNCTNTSNEERPSSVPTAPTARTPHGQAGCPASSPVPYIWTEQGHGKTWKKRSKYTKSSATLLLACCGSDFKEEHLKWHRLLENTGTSFFRARCWAPTLPCQQIFPSQFMLLEFVIWHIPWNKAGDSCNVLILDSLSL